VVVPGDRNYEWDDSYQENSILD
jgi:hypothetical protein